MFGQTAAMEDGREWMAACDVQQRFMSCLAPAPSLLEYGAECRQAHALGGDCCDFVPLPDGRLALAVGDASGKGLAAALMISHVQSSLRTAALFAAGDVAATLRTVNRHVYATSLADRYATLFYGVLDPAALTLRYVNAGHPPLLVLRRDGTSDWLETGGAPVGIFPDWPYEEGTVRLHAGDLIVAYTDGVTEAENPAGEMWGVEGLRRSVAAHGALGAVELVQAIFQDLDQFAGRRPTDDATVLVARAGSPAANAVGKSQ